MTKNVQSLEICFCGGAGGRVGWLMWLDSCMKEETVLIVCM